MTLLLGPPSSGKTTLLLGLAGKLDKDLKVSGRVTYNGHGMDEFVPQRTSAYISQNDLHIGELTVRETLAFSVRYQGVGAKYEILAELARREKEANITPDPDVDIFMKILGPEICADIFVGDELIRGISGGERKRLTTGEMMVGPARALFMDEISTGLDSSTTYQIVNSIRKSIHILQGTAVISLLPPAQETYDLFDDIIILSDGLIVYQGPRENVTLRKDQEQYWARCDETYKFITARNFSEAFQSIHVGRKLGDELAVPFDKSKSHHAALTTKRYGIRKKELLKACTAREYLLMKRNSFVYIFKMTQVSSISKGSTLFKFLNAYVEMASALFRLIAALGRNIIVANTFGSCALFIVLVMGGFILSRDNVKQWLIWGYWISSMMYAQNAIAVNEFLGKSWAHVPPNSTGTDTLGVSFLKLRGIFPEARWYWIGAGALLGYVLLFNFLFTVALAYLNPFGKSQAVLSEETVAERNANKRGNDVQQSTSARFLSSRAGSITEADLKNRRGMILPFKPLSITFDDIRYAVDMPKEMKAQGVIEDRLEFLKGVNGAFRPGVLTALMGVTGAGKTTMDVLAGKKTSGYIEGNISMSGYPKQQETFARIAGYFDAETQMMYIEEVMELVELTPLREALVGLLGVNGLSTEQRKQLTVAVEFVVNPSIIFMDEPTSGLDARAAAIVMRTVRNTVDTGRTLVCTIHQPSIDIFDAFDELLLLKLGGEEIYVGPSGCHSSHLIKYFEGIDGVPKIKDGYNPATWMLEITSVAQEAALGIDFRELYKNSEMYRGNKALIKELSVPVAGAKDLYFQTKYSQSFFTQCMACFWKQHWSYWRNPLYTAVRLIFTFFIALMFGTIFWDLESKSRFNYAAILFLGIQNATAVQPVIAIEKTVFYRERAAGMYSSLPYAFGQVMIELPYLFIQTIIYGVIVYAMVGFEWTVTKFFWYLFFMYFTLLYFTLYGMMTVAVSPNHSIAAIIASAFYAMWNLFCGVVVPKTRMPVWWRWYYYICPVLWTLYGLVASQFGDVQDKLDTNETVEEFIESFFDYKYDFVGYVAVILVGISVSFLFIFAYSIKAFNFEKR
ncbi:Pleiotropic drug resistance protein 3 [Capsicum annuum]|nr:Pleiotropic drug resistance protein 3 [Capsicum annuum]